MSTTLLFRGRRILYGSKPVPLSTEPILPVQYPDPRNSRTFLSSEGFRCRITDAELRVKDGWVDAPTLSRWVGTDLKLLIRAADLGVIDAAAQTGSELPLLRVLDETRLRKLVSDYKKEVRKTLLPKGTSRG